MKSIIKNMTPPMVKLISFFLFISLICPSCTKEKDEIRPLVELNYETYYSASNDCVFLVNVSDDVAFKSIIVYQDSQEIFNSSVSSRKDLRRTAQFEVVCKFNSEGSKIRAVVTDFADNITETTLDFHPEITIQTPTSATSWQSNTYQMINYKVNFDEDVKIELYKDNVFVQNISANSANGECYWLIPWNQPYGTDYKIKISSTAIDAVSVFSDAFTILPYITLDYPNSNTKLVTGTTLDLVWNDNVSENLKIELYKSGVLNQIIVNSTADNSYNWLIPISLTTGSDYKIRISSVNNSSIYTETDNFTINVLADKRVISPDEGYSWTIGSTKSISWSEKLGSNVIIELYKNNSYIQTISSSTSDFIYNWTLPVGLIVANDYSIKVKSNANSADSAISNNFSITNIVNFHLSSPTYGITWICGNSYSIRCNCDVPIESLKIELYKGAYKVASIATISNILAGSYAYTWKIPFAAYSTASNYSIKLTAYTINGTVTTSSNEFNIQLMK